MSKPLPKKELIALIAKARNKARERVSGMMENRGHPQIALMIERNQGYEMALTDVLRAMNGDAVGLHCML